MRDAVRDRRHGAVDGQPGGTPHLLQEIVLDGFLARGQHQFQFGAVADIGPDAPDAAMDALDRGQGERHGEAEEIEIGVVVAAMAVPEDAEGEAAPGLGMDRAVEEGPAVELLPAGLGTGDPVEHDGQTDSAVRRSRPHCGSRRRIRWLRTISTCHEGTARCHRREPRPPPHPGNVPGRDRPASRARYGRPANAAARRPCSRGATGSRNRTRRRPRGGRGRRTSHSRRSSAGRRDRRCRCRRRRW